MTTYTKSIQYDRETRDFAMYLDGELVGFARTYQEAESTLDQLVFELLSAQYYREQQAERADAEAAYHASLPTTPEGDQEGTQIFTPEQAAKIAEAWPTQAEHLLVA